MIPTVFYAQHKVRMWQIYLKSFLADLQDVKLTHLQQQHEVAVWLSDFVKSKSDSEAEEEMKDLHKAFFIKSKDVINFKHEGEFLKAKEAYHEAVLLSEKILLFVDEICKKQPELSSNIQDV